MSLIYTALFGLVVGGAMFLLLFGVRALAQSRDVEAERLYFASTTLTLEEAELSVPFTERIIKPGVASVLRSLGKLTPQRNMKEMQRKLELAGRPYGWGGIDFLGLRLLSAMLFGGLCTALIFVSSLSGPISLLLSVVCVALGFYLPVLWLGRRIGQRQSALVRALPDGLDMLNICVGAGLGFDAAMARIGERWNNELANEFNRVVTEIQIGKPRNEALLDLAARSGVQEVENFVATIVQASQLGVSIAKVLRSQAEQMRILRRQRAEEMARQATIKLLFPLIFLIFPAMLAVLLGPGIPQLLNTMTGLAQ